ncbi:nucleotide disphospho-sugar-binding domain-containing protein [Amycolatopsis nigrescens]|uniref:nucleotide disphospho-sugar-binding domain-containing protein n=1 Tax=Amycolatopsis nigrescens TaxID=381445 RepID=UPI00035EE0A5|nr:nucleotide disphospho-sugar-binding domain-containing protein [Amycolatopsis nigrescens]
MRVLCTAWAWPTHVNQMIPLAWALRAAGHQVGIAVPPPIRDEAAGSGLPVTAVGTDAGSLARFQALVAGEHTGPAGPPGVPRSVEIFSGLADAMADDLLAHARGWRPDVIISDPSAYAGMLVGAALGVPVLRHPWFADVMGFLSVKEAVRAAELAALTPIADRLGAGSFELLGTATIDPCPPSMRLPVPGRRQPIRYVPYHGVHTGDVPKSLLRKGKRPRVCLTWGTTVGRIDPARVPLARLAAALASAGMEPVVAVAADQAGLLGPMPGGVVVAESVRLSELLASCDVVVGHGGAGTIMSGLLNGLPQLAVPLLPDHRFNTGRLVASGAGLSIEAPEATGDAVLDAVRELLEDGAYRARAGELAAEIEAQPSPAEVAAGFAGLVLDQEPLVVS